ncbi:hypothetical protein BC830DRAFT_1175500, partial [Chytriomyces sp. MP71]
MQMRDRAAALMNAGAGSNGLGMKDWANYAQDTNNLLRDLQQQQQIQQQQQQQQSGSGGTPPASQQLDPQVLQLLREREMLRERENREWMQMQSQQQQQQQSGYGSGRGAAEGVPKLRFGDFGGMGVRGGRDEGLLRCEERRNTGGGGGDSENVLEKLLLLPQGLSVPDVDVAARVEKEAKRVDVMKPKRSVKFEEMLVSKSDEGENDPKSKVVVANDSKAIEGVGSKTSPVLLREVTAAKNEVQTKTFVSEVTVISGAKHEPTSPPPPPPPKQLPNPPPLTRKEKAKLRAKEKELARQMQRERDLQLVRDKEAERKEKLRLQKEQDELEAAQKAEELRLVIEAEEARIKAELAEAERKAALETAKRLEREAELELLAAESDAMSESAQSKSSDFVATDGGGKSKKARQKARRKLAALEVYPDPPVPELPPVAVVASPSPIKALPPCSPTKTLALAGADKPVFLSPAKSVESSKPPLSPVKAAQVSAKLMDSAIPVATSSPDAAPMSASKSRRKRAKERDERAAQAEPVSPGSPALTSFAHTATQPQAPAPLPPTGLSVPVFPSMVVTPEHIQQMFANAAAQGFP